VAYITARKKHRLKSEHRYLVSLVLAMLISIKDIPESRFIDERKMWVHMAEIFVDKLVQRRHRRYLERALGLYKLNVRS